MQRKIADTGLLVALCNRRDAAHAWAKRAVEAHEPPWHVCEAVLAEASALLGDPAAVVTMLQSGDVECDFSLRQEAPAVLRLLARYKDQEMDLADACVVRMAELAEWPLVFTVDRKDFSVYRMHQRKAIPLDTPENR
jgi:predicted nucleic acid-binding protein